ncbi:VOC family protein [Streptomyces clavuligerus]|uniref:Glyoxalase/Bleomycin resistance protein/Dioxygenase superfamily n=1 Tax=Streptomyces clavuligerus TaxID=1901 RepID=B5GSM2_STRCL|nr:VOC family protein [Streptomyces clavuligerus]ANW19999.1 bleomycin resistance protein [Streptomyces clavuligerus]AXU14626.1 VOC family protein [Streptomyces clavuligerus]EDY49318.1 glyoxalase/bleomycin resistance protein/dioxygenase [Streptomyces clavuligerus]EFG07112.1 Glyoxalase/Bleomycin resistance protein/Dioxygenase superfamily [Streptomyces clavuligerus]MBY6304639.1 VOC family protein [Streptomyces clavuligerus]
MPATLDHTVVRSHDRFAGARFLAELIGEPEPREFGPFASLALAGGVTLDYLDVEGEIASQHLAFLVSDEEFDTVLAKVVERELPYFADPHAEKPQEINHHFGGRGFYLADPDGHWLEFITHTYVIE